MTADSESEQFMSKYNFYQSPQDNHGLDYNPEESMDKRIDQWISEKRLTQNEAETLNSIDFFESGDVRRKIMRLLREDSQFTRETFFSENEEDVERRRTALIRQSRRESFAEYLGEKVGCSGIIFVIIVIAVVMIKGC